MDTRSLLLKVVAAALHYPGPELRAALPELRTAVAARCGALRGAAPVERFLSEVEPMELLRWQAEYVATFDRGRARSLYLFEHVHGESRARGAAMVELGRLYAAHGYRMDTRELPDYLPAFLEFLSLLDWEEAARWLEGAADVLDAIRARLAADASRYTLLFEALAELAGGEAGLPAAPLVERDDSPAALDEAWAEPAVDFGAPGAACAGCDPAGPVSPGCGG